MFFSYLYINLNTKIDINLETKLVPRKFSIHQIIYIIIFFSIFKKIEHMLQFSLGQKLPEGTGFGLSFNDSKMAEFEWYK